MVDPPVAIAKQWVTGRDFPVDRPLLDVSQAVPSYPPAPELREHIAALALEPATSTYAPATGLPAARAAVAAHMSGAYHAEIGVDDVQITGGCNQAFCLVMQALTEPGDEVILPVPFYFNHDMWLRAIGVEPVYVRLDPSSGLVLDPSEVAPLVSPRTRAIVLVTPNNPSGAEYPPEALAACFEMARDTGIALVLDETYKDFRGPDGLAHDLFDRPAWHDTLVQLFSFSKVFSLAGYRAGSIVAHPALLRETVKLLDCMTIGAPRIAQEAVVFGLAELSEWVAERRYEMRERVVTFRDALTMGAPAWRIVSAGAYFAYLEHPFEGRTSIEVARNLAAEQNLLVIPGELFGPGQEHAVRLAFGNLDAEQVPEVVARLAATVTA